MASRKVHNRKSDVRERCTEEGGLDNPAADVDNQDTVRSLADLLSSETMMAEEDVPPSPRVVQEAEAESTKGSGAAVSSPCQIEKQEEDSDEEARRMGVDAGEIAMIGGGAAFRREASVRSQVSIRSKKKEYPLKIAVSALFICIVVGVSLIFHFYHKQQDWLEVGAMIKFEEATRRIDVQSPTRGSILQGDLGDTMPRDVHYLDCSADNTRKTHMCITWKEQSRLWIDYETHDDVQCYKVAWWGLQHDVVLEDCYNIEDAHWYGVGYISENQLWPIDNMTIPEVLYVTGNMDQSNQLGSVTERYLLSSKGVTIFAPLDYPLYFSFNDMDPQLNQTNKKLCLKSHFLDKSTRQQQNIKRYPQMNYTICVADDINTVHSFSLKEMLNNQSRKSSQLDNNIFNHTVWSTGNLKSLTQESVLQYATEISSNNYSHGHLIFDSRWEHFCGNLQFDGKVFPDTAAMLKNLTSSQFMVTLSATPFIDTRSDQFQTAIRDQLFVLDAGDVAPGLLQYSLPVVNESITAGAVSMESVYFTTKMNELQQQYGVKSVLLKGGSVESLPYGPDLGAFNKPNVNLYTEEYVKAAYSVHRTVFTESASQSQQMLPFIAMRPLPSSWKGLQSIIADVLTLGLIGYPFILPDVVGGSLGRPSDGAEPDTELYIRWLELCAFLPIMHFSYLPHSLEGNVEHITRKYIDFHVTYIVPIFTETLQLTITNNEPIIKPVWWVAPDDEEVFVIDDQFLIGDELLVAPVLKRNTTTRDIYLPEGYWLDKLRNTLYTGPKWIYSYAVELNEISYFVWQSQ